MTKYNHIKIEQKWKKIWEKTGLYKTKEDKNAPKFYVLDMFPYPSGAGLHVGHPKGYIATDVVARMKGMQGFNVLHPMGWDAFGLPAENYAIKNKVHPSVAVKKNIATFKKQLGLLGFTYDWDKEINTTDPEYYKWTQWIFLQMFKKGLVFESYEPINWCPKCLTGLANEDLENGLCERCGSEIERKPMRQWVLRITDYADRLLKDIEKLKDWPEAIKEMQKNWIGRSEGAIVSFEIKTKDLKEELEVFTTRPDTLFGATYMVVSPEHKIIDKLKENIKNWEEVKKYLKQANKKSDLERTDLAKEKIGVELKGVSAINPVNNKEIPVFVADYVLVGYGTGAIMAVPAHDERDFEFAKKYNLPIQRVVFSNKDEKVFSGFGKMINSDFLNGLDTQEAKKEMIKWLKEKKAGKEKVQYKLRDWVFSRQRYWGEPIPLIHCNKCGWQPVPEKDLPLELPKVKSYEPTGTGESPLADIKKWVKTKCPECNGEARRETNTMPQWAGSCWYYLRYIDSKNKKELVNKTKEKYWSPVDLYVGGAEHATRHLIYARFWHKFLFDIGVVSYEEPFVRLQNVGLILAEDGRKMSKRWGNVINPDGVVKEFGADSMRLYEMFMGPFDQPCAWNTQGLVGMKRFLEKVWRIFQEKEFVECGTGKCGDIPKEIPHLFHKTIKKVTEDIESMNFNTAISQMMVFINEAVKYKTLPKKAMQKFLILLSPFAPHISEELWILVGGNESIFKESWPKYNPDLIKDQEITLAIQVNGKLRDTIKVSSNISEEEAKKLSLNTDKIKNWLGSKKPKKIIYVKGKLVSVVV